MTSGGGRVALGEVQKITFLHNPARNFSVGSNSQQPAKQLMTSPHSAPTFMKVQLLLRSPSIISSILVSAVEQGIWHVRQRLQIYQTDAIDIEADTTFPTDLPKPEDDGACNHLSGLQLPSIPLPTARDASKTVDLSALPGLTICFIYPRTGAPGEIVPDRWNAIPGARGCTPQACSFRDNLPTLKQLGVENCYGLSTQDSDYQKEAQDRLHLPYDLLSDHKLELQSTLKLPAFEWEGKKVMKRMCLAIEGGKVIKYWYPIFPPDANVHEVISWLKESRQ